MKDGGSFIQSIYPTRASLFTDRISLNFNYLQNSVINIIPYFPSLPYDKESQDNNSFTT